ncbi:MAG: hypothetical protein HRU14_06290, partial [Planctomycetes bacterium]|nr:hypothetical protein [Planctomycetota bacterium]
MPGATFWIQCLLFLPLFLVINLVAAVPGRADLKDVAKVGFRHFYTGTAMLIGTSAVLYFL